MMMKEEEQVRIKCLESYDEDIMPGRFYTIIENTYKRNGKVKITTDDGG